MRYFYHPKKHDVLEHYIISNNNKKIERLWVKKHRSEKFKEFAPARTPVRDECKELTEQEFNKRLLLELL